MINMSAFPLCSARLKWNSTRHDDPQMNHYWAAVIVASFCHDEALTEFGGFDFDDRSDANGIALLARLEACIKARRHKVAKMTTPVVLAALLGSRGVKTSALKSEHDYALASEVLFSPALKRDVPFSELVDAVKTIPKHVRKANAAANLMSLPAEWVSSRKAQHITKKGTAP